MTRRSKIEQLCSTIDAAVACAEQAGLPFVVLLLDMARLEVDQTTKNNVINLPTSRLLGRQRGL